MNQIKSLRVQAEADRKNCALASENTQKVRKQQETLEQKEIQWKKQSEELAEVDKKLVLAENKSRKQMLFCRRLKTLGYWEIRQNNAVKMRLKQEKIMQK